MQIIEIMSKPVVTCAPESTVRSVAGLMAEHDVGCIPVVSETEVLGVVTDRDIATRAVAAGADPTRTTANQIMTRERLCSVAHGEPLSTADRLMREHKVRRLLVVGDKDEIVGIVSLGDLARTSGELEGSHTDEVLAGVCS